VKFLRAFDKRQQQVRWLAIPIAVVKKFSDDGAGGLAALIAYYGFFSLFPLLLVLFTVLAYVLHGDPGAQNSIRNSVVSQFPVIGTDISKNIHTLHGHVISLVVGLAGSLLGGLGVTQASQNAFARVWAVPMKERPNFLQSRLRGLALLTALGVLFIISTVASGLVSGGLGGPGAKVAGIAVSLLVNFALFLAAFRFLTPVIGTSRLWVGVGLATVLWTILQVVGGYYVGHVFKHTSSTYGAFGFVIALLVWLRLGAQIVLYSAEINVVLTRKLWPRSLFGPPSTPADEQTLTELAKVEERHDEEEIDVDFRTDGPEPAEPRRQGEREQADQAPRA
jgi:YihY family inner membrane protein